MKPTNHLSKVASIKIVLNKGITLSQLTVVPIRNKFNTEFSSVNHVKIGKPNPKLVFPIHITMIINIVIFILNWFIIIILEWLYIDT